MAIQLPTSGRKCTLGHQWGGIFIETRFQRTAYTLDDRSGLKPNAIRSLLLRPKGRS
ncbi:MAG: hypothetical protein J0L94_12040 [Rhodothermia bacterium]|nr:hypothetical protein [Rhodothermia bacterium]